MNWFLIAFIGYFFLALTFVLDKFILTKTVSKPVVYTFYSTVFSFLIILAYPFGVVFLNTNFDWLVALLSGLAFGLAMWTQFVAVKNSEASHVNPFLGGVVTIFTYLLSNYFLSEKLTDFQISGMIILIFACFLLSFEKTEKRSGLNLSFFWAILSGLLYAFSHVFAKYLYEIYPFLTALVWSKASVGVLAVFLLFFPSVWKTFKKNKKEDIKKIKKKKTAILIVIIAKVLATLAIGFIQYASAIGSVTLVMAMSGIQYILMFILIILSTKLIPKIFKEYFTKKELIVEWIAMFLVAVGSILFII
jgi:drug/metabolite transporter (DMT)-like permease